MRRIAIGWLSTLLVYYEIYRWIPLRRWNWQFAWPVTNDQFFPDIVIGGLLALFIVGFSRSWPAVQWCAVALLGLWSALHFYDWWLPYLHDDPANYPRFHFYSEHTQLLPVIGNHYPPDGGHAVLDLLLFPTCIACLLAAFRRRRRTG